MSIKPYTVLVAILLGCVAHGQKIERKFPIQASNPKLQMEIRNAGFLDSNRKPVKVPRFDFNEQFYLRLDVVNYTRTTRGEVWVLEDFLLANPNGQIFMTEFGMVENHEIQDKDDVNKRYTITNNLRFNRKLPAGTYRVRLRIRDELSLAAIVQDFFFTLGKNMPHDPPVVVQPPSPPPEPKPPAPQPDAPTGHYKLVFYDEEDGDKVKCDYSIYRQGGRILVVEGKAKEEALHKLPAGKYDVHVRQDAAEDWLRGVTILAGKTYNQNVYMNTGWLELRIGGLRDKVSGDYQVLDRKTKDVIASGQNATEVIRYLPEGLYDIRVVVNGEEKWKKLVRIRAGSRKFVRIRP